MDGGLLMALWTNKSAPNNSNKNAGRFESKAGTLLSQSGRLGSPSLVWLAGWLAGWLAEPGRRATRRGSDVRAFMAPYVLFSNLNLGLVPGVAGATG